MAFILGFVGPTHFALRYFKYNYVAFITKKSTELYLDIHLTYLKNREKQMKYLKVKKYIFKITHNAIKTLFI